MGYEIDISVESIDDMTVLYIAGDITAVTGQSVEEACKSKETINSQHILMHFNQDCYFNSGGIGYLIGIASNARKNGQALSITGVSDHFKKIFAMVGLTRWVDMHNGMDNIKKTH